MSRLERLNYRRIDNDLKGALLLNESYRNIAQSEAVKYVIGAMQPIDPEYTKNSYAQAERVRNQLEKGLPEKCSYRYQGSVTNDTHIKAKSDIDLLVIIDKFLTLERPQEPMFPYKGDPIQDLLDLRASSERCLKTAFPQASLDISGSKAIAIEGGSLTRKVDVVPSNWYNTNKYAETKDDIYRGVQILDKTALRRIENTPFLHNALIDIKDKTTNGGLRKASRLMKSLKYDTENIGLSSYDIVSIAFNMSVEYLNQPHGRELQILAMCLAYCKELQQNAYLRLTITVPDGHRAIFTDGHATLNGLNQLTDELEKLTTDVLSENYRSFQKLSEARVDY